MKKLTSVLIGAGNRGCIYADYSLIAPEELEIIAIIEPNDLRRNDAGKKYNVPENRRYINLEDFINDKIQCDFVINATMDSLHYHTAKLLLNNGYNMLLEKPIVSNEDELKELQKITREKNLKVIVCHVLRYSPFYKKIKEIINSGVIGEILTMELNEHVGIAHFVDSFVRGKWGREEECGSGFLLQKSCHDMDLICWLNNKTKPDYVSSFGSRSLFVKENKPKDATEYCFKCPYEQTCLYSAQKIHVEFDSMPFQTWEDMNKPLNEITKEEKIEWLKTHPYGRCVYDNGGDINDRQTVIVQFENGSTATFTMVGGVSRAQRYLHICGSKGEIEGKLDSNKFVLRIFDRSEKNFDYTETEFNLENIVENNKYDGHGGGDYAIMYELCRYLNGNDCSVSITKLDDSVNSHLVVYAAEKSNKEKIAVKI